MSRLHPASPALRAPGDCFLIVLTFSIIPFYSYIAFADFEKVIMENAEEVLTKAEVWQSHNRTDLSKGKRLFKESKETLNSQRSIIDRELCKEGIAAIFEFHKSALPKFEKFSELFLAVSEKRCKKILDSCLLVQVKKKTDFF